MKKMLLTLAALFAAAWRGYSASPSVAERR